MNINDENIIEITDELSDEFEVAKIFYLRYLQYQGKNRKINQL